MPPVTAPLTQDAGARIIADRGEFIDVLRALARGHILVRLSDLSGGCSIDGSAVYRSFEPLVRYGLIREFDNPQGFGGVRYFRLTERGCDFAARAVQSWQRRPLLERLITRLVG
jgi:DNA-binding IclR family transcriptional regulator